MKVLKRRLGRNITGIQPAGKKKGRGGKLAFGSLAAIALGAVVRDLRRPNSLVRGLVREARDRFVEWRESRPGIDIDKKMEVRIADEVSPDLAVDIESKNQQEV